MSYFDQPAEFLGEMPLPEAIGNSDPGILALKSNADHSHDFVPKDWLPVLLAGTWAWYGGTTRQPEYTRIGGLALLRGVFSNGTPQNPPSVVGTIPVDYCPQNGMREVFNCQVTGGSGQVDILADGRIIYQSGPVGINILFFGTIVWSID